MLEKTGRECAKLGQLSVKFKGNPDGYFATAKEAWGTEASWDREKGVITVAVPDGPCGCPLVDANRAHTAALVQLLRRLPEGSFEAIFGHPVQTRLKESKLGGAARCVFEVTVS